MSKIEWTDQTWNPITGCDKVSPGCDHCYAERMAKRLKAMGVKSYKDGFKLTLQPQILEKPLKWKKPKMIFVNSMSDLFHKEIPLPYLLDVFDIMGQCPQHIFQILTKRSKHLKKINWQLSWHDNVWMGVSVESKEYKFRIRDLQATDAKLKFLSCEPLLGHLGTLDLTGIDWVIVGGESGPGARPMDKIWVYDIMWQCQKAGVPFFFKQWGGVNKKKAGRILDGRTYDGIPKGIKC